MPFLDNYGNPIAYHLMDPFGYPIHTTMSSKDTPKPPKPLPGFKNHPNGGGLVANSADVAETVYVGPEARVEGKAILRDYARVEGKAVVKGNAKMSDFAIIRDNASIRDFASLTGNVVVGEDAEMWGYSDAKGCCQILGRSRIWDHGCVRGSTVVQDDAQIYGSAKVEVSKVQDRALLFGYITVEGEDLVVGGDTRLSSDAQVERFKNSFEALHHNDYHQPPTAPPAPLLFSKAEPGTMHLSHNQNSYNQNHMVDAYLWLYEQTMVHGMTVAVQNHRGTLRHLKKIHAAHGGRKEEVSAHVFPLVEGETDAMQSQIDIVVFGGIETGSYSGTSYSQLEELAKETGTALLCLSSRKIEKEGLALFDTFSVVNAEDDDSKSEYHVSVFDEFEAEPVTRRTYSSDTGSLLPETPCGCDYGLRCPKHPKTLEDKMKLKPEEYPSPTTIEYQESEPELDAYGAENDLLAVPGDVVVKPDVEHLEGEPVAPEAVAEAPEENIEVAPEASAEVEDGLGDAVRQGLKAAALRQTMKVMGDASPMVLRAMAAVGGIMGEGPQALQDEAVTEKVESLLKAIRES